jgi:acetyltransferase
MVTRFDYSEIEFIKFILGLLMLSQNDDSMNSESITLTDGTPIIIRPIRPDDADDLQATFQRLSMQSIYLRFLSFKKELSDEEARYLATLDYTTRMAFVAVCKENDQDSVVGVARYALLDTGHLEIAESAVVVADEYQGRGIGKLLLWRLVSYARAKGIHSLRGNLQIGNDRMLDLVRRSGLPHQQRYVDGIWEVTIDLELPKHEP